MFAPFAFMGGAAAAIVQPDEISGLVSWYDFSDSGTITESGGRLSAITDKSTSNITMTSAVNDPYYSSTGGPNSTAYIYTNDGAADYYLQAASNYPGPTNEKLQTVFFIGYFGTLSYDSVVHTTKFPAATPIFLKDSTSSPDDGVFSLKDGGGSPPYGSSFNSNQGTGTSNWVYAIGIGDSGTNYTSEAYYSSAWNAGASRAYGSVTGYTPLRFLRGNSFRSTGGVSEFFGYDRVLTSTEIDDMKAYIEDKYGL